MSATRSTSTSAPTRIVLFGATGHLGHEILSRLEASSWPEVEVVGVVSGQSEGKEFEFRGDVLEASTETPPLRDGDLVLVCTPGEVANDIVRGALRSSVPCIDCTGWMAREDAVSMPVLAHELASSALATAPLIALPGATTLAWAPLIEGWMGASRVARIVATVTQSAAALGRDGVVALSEESIALFNQSAEPQRGPAGQPIAFDVIPSAESESRTAAELARVFGPTLRADIAYVQVPVFVGEGASLAIEFESPLDESTLAKVLDDLDGFERVEEGLGSRGLTAVDAGRREPTGPTLRDAAGAEQVLVGGLRADATLPGGSGWRVWLSYDPVAVVAAHALRLAALRFPTA